MIKNGKLFFAHLLEYSSRRTVHAARRIVASILGHRIPRDDWSAVRGKITRYTVTNILLHSVRLTVKHPPTWRASARALATSFSASRIINGGISPTSPGTWDPLLRASYAQVRFYCADEAWHAHTHASRACARAILAGLTRVCATLFSFTSGIDALSDTGTNRSTGLFQYSA